MGDEPPIKEQNYENTIGLLWLQLESVLGQADVLFEFSVLLFVGIDILLYDVLHQIVDRSTVAFG